MIRLNRPLVVEGRYDKSKLSSFVEGVILTTNGFGVFSHPETLALIRRLAEKNGVAVLTDSDAAGFRIRNYLKSAVGPEKIVHVYIPDVYGRERRKTRPSKEGKLGVEGIERGVLERALRRAGVVHGEEAAETVRISKAQLYEWGLSGGQDSASRRRQLQRRLGLPENLSANALCEILGGICSMETLEALMKECGGEGDGE